jgi:hypothetical protein
MISIVPDDPAGSSIKPRSGRLVKKNIDAASAV